MGYVLVAFALIVLVAAGAFWARRRGAAQRVHEPSIAPVTPSPTGDVSRSDGHERRAHSTTPSTPMTGLESALAETKDRSGRSFQERLDAARIESAPTGDDASAKLGHALDNLTKPSGTSDLAGSEPSSPDTTDS